MQFNQAGKTGVALPCGPRAGQSYRKARRSYALKRNSLPNMYRELLQSISSLARMCEGKQEQRSENCEIGCEVSWETPVLAGVTETAAGDVESANFCRNCREREDHDRRTQNRQRATIQKPKHKPERTENFQPRKIKRERDTDGPRQNFVIVDVAGELNRINCLERSGVDENAGENKIENSPEKTPNVQR